MRRRRGAFLCFDVDCDPGLEFHGEAVGKSVCLHIISRSKAFDLFPRTHKGKNRCVLRKKHALINSRERPLKSDINLEQSSHVETVVLLSHKSPDSVINVKVEFGEGDDKISLDAIAERAKKYQPKPKITYKMIQEYAEKRYGFKVHTAYIAEVKRSLGLTMYDAPNVIEELKQPRKRQPKEKVEAIMEALKYFEVI